jgi:hypothetical protein
MARFEITHIAPEPSRRATTALIVALMMIVGCEKELTLEQKRQNAISAVGTDASITAAFLVSAVRACQVVGLNEIDRCAELEGSLLAEQTAQMQAKAAVDQRSGYWKNCLATFAEDYCKQLIQRAVAIEFRKPEHRGS